MIAKLKSYHPRLVVYAGTALFGANIILAYILSPHWGALSHFAEHWYTFIPFAAAMGVAIFELIYAANLLRKLGGITTGSNALYASAGFMTLVVCVPFLGSPLQKDIHDLAALLFALSVIVGFAAIAKRLRNYILAILSGLLFAICVLELILLARYNTHPVQSWVWTALELGAIVLLVAGLDVLAATVSRLKGAK